MKAKTLSKSRRIHLKYTALEKRRIKKLTKTKQHYFVEKVIKNELYVLETLSIPYRIVLKGSNNYNIRTEIIQLSLDKLLHNVKLFEETYLLKEENGERKRVKHKFSKEDIVKAVFYHELGHALSKTIKSVLNRRKELFRKMNKLFSERKFEEILNLHHEYFDLEYEEEVKAWDIAEDYFEGDMKTFRYVRFRCLRSYENSKKNHEKFIEQKIEKKDISKVAAEVTL